MAAQISAQRSSPAPSIHFTPVHATLSEKFHDSFYRVFSSPGRPLPYSFCEELLRNGLEPIKEAKNRTSIEINYLLF